MRYEWAIGLRYLVSKRGRMVSLITAISISGVALGVMLLIVVLSVMGGFATDLKTKIVSTKAHVVINADRGNLTNPEDLLAVVQDFPMVVGSMPYIETEVMISTASNVDGIVLRGIDTERIGSVSELPNQITGGDLGWLHEPQRARNARLHNDPADYESFQRNLDELRQRTRELQLQTAAIHGQIDGTGQQGGDLEGSGRPLGDIDGTGQGSGRGAEPSDSVMPPIVYTMPPIPGPIGTNQGGEPVGSDFIMPGIPGSDLPVSTAADLRAEREIPGIAIGTELADKLHVEVGEEVTVINPDGQILPTGPAPLSRPFVVVAIFNTGLYEFDTRFAYVTLDEAQDFLNIPEGQVTAIDIRLEDLDRAAQVEQLLSARLTAEGFDGVLVRSWEKLNRSLFTALKLEKIVIFTILTIIILVASFSIVSNLIIMVVERAPEIAILKSMGSTNIGIMKVFAIEGGIIGGIGTLVGLILGIGTCLFISEVGIPLDTDVYYIEYLPVDMELVEVLLTAVAGMVISLLATVYPALKAARLNPSEALRYD